MDREVKLLCTVDSVWIFNLQNGQSTPGSSITISSIVIMQKLTKTNHGRINSIQSPERVKCLCNKDVIL